MSPLGIDGEESRADGWIEHSERQTEHDEIKRRLACD